MDQNKMMEEWGTDYIISAVLAVLITAASVAGILFQDKIYPTEELVTSFCANDVVNLLVGLPVLLVPMWLAHRGKLIGKLFWLGALFYMVYNYLVYLLSMPFNGFYILFPLIVGGSVWGIFRLLGKLDRDKIGRQLAGRVPARLGGGVLLFLGIGYAARAIGVIASSSGSDSLTATVLGLNLADLFLSLTWIAGGTALWRKTSLGLTLGGSLLYQGSMLFLAVILLLLVQPFVLGGAIIWVDVIVLAVMALVVFIPLGLFMRGVSLT